MVFTISDVYMARCYGRKYLKHFCDCCILFAVSDIVYLFLVVCYF